MARRIDLDVLGLALAGVLVAGALALLAIPGAESALPGPVQSLDDVLPADALEPVLALALALVAFVGLVRLRPGRRDEDRSGRRTGGDRGAGKGDEARTESGDQGGDSWRKRTRSERDSPGVVGNVTTERYERMVDSLGSLSGCPEPEPLSALRDAAIELEQSRGYDAAAARERVDRGAWTADPVAAAFLGEPEAGELSLRRRLYGAIYPDRAFERRFERTLRALEAVAAEEVAVGGRTTDHGATARDRDREDGGETEEPIDGSSASGEGEPVETGVDPDGVA